VLRCKTVVTALGACAVGVVVSLVRADIDRSRGSRPVASRPAPAQAPASVAAPARASADAAASAILKTTAAARERARARGAAASEAARDEALCRRAAAVGPGGSEGLASSPSNDPAILAAERRIDAALRASRDPFAQAVAAWLDASHAMPSFRARQERLAQQAQTTGDPRIYAMAYRECLKGVDDEAAPACQALSARQWARLDSGNAMPWVYVLGEAIARGDTGARDEALFQIAASPRIDERPYAVAQVILDNAHAGGAGLVAADELVSQALGMSAAQKLPLYALFSACRGAAPEDANIGQLCVEAADLLENRSDTLAMRRIGGAIEVARGDDTARRDRLRDEAMRLGTPPSLHESAGCASLRDAHAFFRRAGEVGEVVALRERSTTPAAR
jgi:hypothetical protein